MRAGRSPTCSWGGGAGALWALCCAATTRAEPGSALDSWARAHVPTSGCIEARYVNTTGAGESWCTYDFGTGAWSLVLPEYWVRVGPDGSYDYRDAGQRGAQHLPAAPIGAACALEGYLPLVGVRNLLARTDLEVESSGAPDGGVVVTIRSKCGTHCTNPAVSQLPATEERVVLTPEGRVASWTFDAGGKAEVITFSYNTRSPARCPVVETAHGGAQRLAEVTWTVAPKPGAMLPEALDARSSEARAAKAEWIARAARESAAADAGGGSASEAGVAIPGAGYRAPFLWTGALLILAGGYAAWRSRRGVRS